MRRIGYARVSTVDQDTALQLDALERASVDFVYQEKGSGVGPRPQLHVAIASLRPGDVFVVWKLDRIARSLADLLSIIARVKASGATIRSLTEPIDTSSTIGNFTVQILGAVAELERNIIRERTVAGQRAAMVRGVRFGRPRQDVTAEDYRVAAWWSNSGLSQRDASALCGVSRGAFRGSLRRAGVVI